MEGIESAGFVEANTFGAHAADVVHPQGFVGFVMLERGLKDLSFVGQRDFVFVVAVAECRHLLFEFRFPARDDGAVTTAAMIPPRRSGQKMSGSW